jgi:hypothetical protein
MQLNIDEARIAFESFGAALAKLEPINKREAAKVRMRMDAEVFGLCRFLRRNYWRWWLMAYWPNGTKVSGARDE